MSMVTTYLDMATHDIISSNPVAAFDFANSLTSRESPRKVNLSICTTSSKDHIILGRRHLIECLLTRLYQRAGWYLLLRATYYPWVVDVHSQAKLILHTYSWSVLGTLDKDCSCSESSANPVSVTKPVTSPPLPLCLNVHWFRRSQVTSPISVLNASSCTSIPGVV